MLNTWRGGGTCHLDDGTAGPSSFSEILDDEGPDDGSPTDPSSGPSARRLLVRLDLFDVIDQTHTQTLLLRQQSTVRLDLGRSDGWPR